MKSKIFILIFISLIVFSCKNEDAIVDSNNVSAKKSSLAKISTVPSDNTALTMLFNWKTGSNDHVPTLSPSENNSGTDIGQLAYILNEATPGTDYNLFRLFLNGDHMASNSNNEGGYNLEWTLGGLWSSNSSDLRLGSEALYRYRSSGTGDHDIGFINGYHPSGYTQEGILGYGFRRYLTGDNDLATLSNGTVTLTANRVAGGSIWQLNWNSTDFINHYDYGREIQIAMNMNATPNNPTEAGDRYSYPELKEITIDGVHYSDRRHGSPLISLTTDGSSFLNTACRPLNWFNDTFLVGTGLDPLYHPLVWNGRFEKSLSFVSGHPRILKWVTTIYYPSYSSTDVSEIEVATAYLNSQFNRFYIFNGASNVSEVTVPTGDVGLEPQNNSNLHLANGGVIISDASGNKALGLYYKSSGSFHERDGFSFYNYTNRTGSGPDGDACTKWNLRKVKIGGSTSFTYTVYLVVGSLADCIIDMSYLEANGFTNTN